MKINSDWFEINDVLIGDLFIHQGYIHIVDNIEKAEGESECFIISHRKMFSLKLFPYNVKQKPIKCSHLEVIDQEDLKITLDEIYDKFQEIFTIKKESVARLAIEESTKEFGNGD